MEKDFILNHMVLYCKNWYKQSTCVWRDLQRAILCDGEYMPQDKSDVAYIMLKFCRNNADFLENGHVFKDVLEFHFAMRKISETKRIIQHIYQCEVDRDYLDNVIDLCRDTLAYSNKIDSFTSVKKPNKYVLPLRRYDNSKDTRKERGECIDAMFKKAMPMKDEKGFDYYRKREPLHEYRKRGYLVYENEKDKKKQNTNVV